MNPSPRTVHRLAVVATALFLSALPASAQDRPAPALDLAAGWVGFADDGIVSEMPFAAAARWYLSPRTSIGPEVTFIGGGLFRTSEGFANRPPFSATETLNRAMRLSIFPQQAAAPVNAAPVTTGCRAG